MVRPPLSTVLGSGTDALTARWLIPQILAPPASWSFLVIEYDQADHKPRQCFVIDTRLLRQLGQYLGITSAFIHMNHVLADMVQLTLLTEAAIQLVQQFFEPIHKGAAATSAEKNGT